MAVRPARPKLVVVVAVAAIGNRTAGALAAVSAAAWFDFFFTQPFERFTIRSSADLTTALLLLAVGIAVSQLAARARRLRIITITDAGYLTQIHQTASLATSAAAPDAKPTRQARLVAVTLADQVGRAFSTAAAWVAP